MSKAKEKLQTVLNAIEDIEFIRTSKELKITQAIQDKVAKPAIRMNLVKIAEQFTKLKNDNEFGMLQNFSNEDLRGINAVRNFIAHDYDSTDDNIIEDVVRYNLPKFKKIVKSLLDK